MCCPFIQPAWLPAGVAVRGGGEGQAISPEPWPPQRCHSPTQARCFLRLSQRQAAASLTHSVLIYSEQPAPTTHIPHGASL